jgi:hypothetical protein
MANPASRDSGFFGIGFPGGFIRQACIQRGNHKTSRGYYARGHSYDATIECRHASVLLGQK